MSLRQVKKFWRYVKQKSFHFQKIKSQLGDVDFSHKIFRFMCCSWIFIFKDQKSCFVFTNFRSLPSLLPLLSQVLRIHERLTFANVIRCFRLRHWVGYVVYFKFAPVLFYLMFLMVFFSSIKGINIWIRKETSNVY